jgi:ketosteroid isomerase-like protein
MAGNDRPSLLKVLAEEIVWHTPPSTIPQLRGPHRGRDAVLELIDGAGASLFVRGSKRIEIEHVIAEGEFAAAQFRQIARTTAGHDYDNLYVFFFRVVDEQIHEVWENVDTAYALAKFDMNAASWLS